MFGGYASRDSVWTLPDLASFRRGSYRHLLFAGFVGLLVLAATALAAHLLGHHVEDFTREPQTIGNESWYIGGLSQLGGVVWFAAGGILTFTAYVDRGRRNLFAFAATVTWLLGLDDIFLLHDAVYPHLGVPEAGADAFYFILIADIVWRFHRDLQRSTLVAIGLTVVLWIGSAAMDDLFNFSVINLDQLTEDGLKFLGILIWCTGWIVEAAAGLVSSARLDQARSAWKRESPRNAVKSSSPAA